MEGDMKVEVLGSGCKKCEELYENTLKAINELSGHIQVEKISDVNYIAKMGVFMTPALVVDGKVVSVGKSLTVDEIKEKIMGNR
jgi:small redox-active disulfide protein 2